MSREDARWARHRPDFRVQGLTAVSLESFKWFCKRFPVLGPAAGRVFYWVLSVLILVFSAVVAWHVSWHMAGLGWASPGGSWSGFWSSSGAR
jgi:hypothetical protein